MIEVSYSWNGRRSTGVEINGLDIGASCLRSVYMERENRRVIKVKGRTRTRLLHDGYTHPQIFLIMDDKVVANVEYDREDTHKAKDLIIQFISKGVVPTEMKF